MRLYGIIIILFIFKSFLKKTTVRSWTTDIRFAHFTSWFKFSNKFRKFKKFDYTNSAKQPYVNNTFHLQVHRLVVVDEEDKVIGIISLSDLLMYLVLRPTGECGGASLRNEHSSIEEKDETVVCESADTKPLERGDATGKCTTPDSNFTAEDDALRDFQEPKDDSACQDP